jgi:hypothetical protein
MEGRGDVFEAYGERYRASGMKYIFHAIQDLVKGPRNCNIRHDHKLYCGCERCDGNMILDCWDLGFFAERDADVVPGMQEGLEDGKTDETGAACYLGLGVRE